ncbi:hypothetical protein EB001_05275 [bacterium]|nr:hypothetical protein [bacterium]
MFVSETLKTHLETSATINIQSLVLAEWNMNMPDNIFKVGNYRYRPRDVNSIYNTLPSTFDQLDTGNYYTGATDADVVVDGGFDNDGVPQQFKLNKDKMKMIYSLEDCLKPFRPRSGINKALYMSGRYLANSGADISERPRYYMPSRYDQFRYWTSYRTEDGNEYGVAKNLSNGLYFIDDAAPFVVYKEQVPTNRIIVKMQTNVGDVDLGPFATNVGNINDPLFGEVNKTTPTRWKIQSLENNNWTTIYTINEFDTRDDETNSPIIGSDGYVELEYGLIIPDAYKNIFIFAERLSSSTLLPESNVTGYAYLVVDTDGEVGTFHIWTGTEYETFDPVYGWKLGSETITNQTSFVDDLTSPDSFTDAIDGGTKYRQFQYLRGLRIVVDTMNKQDSTFDLIEFSPRLVVNLSDKVVDYRVTKMLSDLGNGSIPVGQLLASNGSMTMFDDDQAFNDNNTNSIIADYLRKNIKFNFYEKIINVDGFDYFIPIKTLYSDGFPQADITGATVSLNLRDFYFFLESMPAPRLLMTQTSLSVAVSTLLDYIGFSNYTFRRIVGESDPVIPFFFVAPDQNVAEVLTQLAVATQSAMFFDEYNNFIVMSKEYLLPEIENRSTDFVLSGSNNQTDNGVIKNQTSGNLPNVISIASQDKKVYNDGKISYTTRYIQRSFGSIKQASLVDREKTWIYKPVLLWEVAGTENLKTVNEVVSRQGNYVLSAMPINSELTTTPPTVSNGAVINNILDLGENVYWLTRYQGYFYANGEIIRYDAVQFNITGTGNVWISSNEEYQRYFASLPFNGKIYPTGLIRIYSLPYYETVDGNTRMQSGAVYQHGRGQFGTPIVEHNAGINSYWTNNDYVRGCEMQTQYLFTTVLDEDVSLPSTTVGAAGVNNSLARQTTRNGIIKNFLTTNYLTETQVNNLKTTQTGTVQSSALVMNGPSFKTTETPLNFVSYVYKDLNNAYRHFGTRMRIVGKIENSEVRGQTPIGSTPYFQVTGAGTNQNISIGGGSGGIAVLLNPETNNGYYFEITALTENNIEQYLKIDSKTGQGEVSINNIVFYKVKKDSSNNNAIPVKLWGGLSQILVDDGRFTGQYRMMGEENPTVYDLSVEYQDIGNTRRFYLYINNKLIKIVDDKDPLPIYNNMALFVRGSSRCMFENIYAITNNYAQNTVFTVGETISSVFGDKQIDANEAFRKYAMSGIVQSTYLSGISAQQPPKYNIYFEEFGTIMRECAYFDIRYDRAYPALYAKLSPTFNRIKGYSVSGFQADSYGAEFLIFNATDTALNLDETTGNYLRIQGITFTQDTTHDLTVDEYYKKKSNLSDPEFQGSSTTTSALVEKTRYDEIKLSRLIYGKNEFSIDSLYIQTQDHAEEILGWIINKTKDPKKTIGIEMFAIPTIQLGDIVTLTYQDKDQLDLVTSPDTRFVIYNIEYGRSNTGPSMTVYLSEV